MKEVKIKEIMTVDSAILKLRALTIQREEVLKKERKLEEKLRREKCDMREEFKENDAELAKITDAANKCLDVIIKHPENKDGLKVGKKYCLLEIDRRNHLKQFKVDHKNKMIQDPSGKYKWISTAGVESTDIHGADHYIDFSGRQSERYQELLAKIEALLKGDKVQE